MGLRELVQDVDDIKGPSMAEGILQIAEQEEHREMRKIQIQLYLDKIFRHIMADVEESYMEKRFNNDIDIGGVKNGF